MRKIRVIDLFSGCGGFSYGFEKEGYEICLGVDNDSAALSTFKHNHKNSNTLNFDLSNNNSIQNIADKYKDVDVIMGGPPCQGFSLTGTRNENDPRNTLSKALFNLAEILNPKAIVIENVPSLLTLYKGKAKNQIIKMCHKLGYTVNYKVLYAPDFGIPQIRKRVFFVALKKKLGVFEFPNPVLSESDYISCSDAISDLPSLISSLGEEVQKYTKSPLTQYQKTIRKGSKNIYNHIGTKHSDLVVNTIKLVPEGGNHKDLPSGVGDSRKFNEAWTRYHSKKPSKTIDTGHRNHFHYKWNRVPTVRENARLQSFDDKFIFLGNKTQQYRQVGNAVPPLLGYHIAKQLRKYLK